MKTRNLLLLLALGLLLVPALSPAASLASPEEDRKAKQAVPPAGKALVYVYRTGGGARVAPTVTLNKSELGALAPQTYYMVPVAPGRVDLRAGGSPVLALRVQDGRIYFVHLAVEASGEGALAQVGYGRGRKEMHGARLARITQPVATAKRDGAGKPATAPAGRAGFNLIVKGGSMTLASGSQTLLATDIDFTTGGTGFGLEGEWITASGWAVGAEYLAQSHSYTSTAGNGDLAGSAVMLNFKKYFRYGATAQPYVGLGLGAAVANMSGAINGSAGGFAAQAMGGVAVRWEHVGLYTELKYRSASTEDASGEGVDLGGSGVFAGLSVLF